MTLTIGPRDCCVPEGRRVERLHYASNGHAVLVIFQGMDAAGKDGAIRQVVSGVNPQGCLIHENFSARQGVEDDDLNVICPGGLVVGQALAWELLATFAHRRRAESSAFGEGIGTGMPGRLLMTHTRARGFSLCDVLSGADKVRWHCDGVRT